MTAIAHIQPSFGSRSATFTRTLSAAELHEVYVRGRGTFQMQFWRDAINSYLAGVWGNKKEVMDKPGINFGGVNLRLDPVLHVYFIHGVSPDDAVPVLEGKVLVVLDTQNEVEIALVRFVKDESITQISIIFSDNSKLVLWKKKGKRGEYGAYADVR